MDFSVNGMRDVKPPLTLPLNCGRDENVNSFSVRFVYIHVDFSEDFSGGEMLDFLLFFRGA